MDEKEYKKEHERIQKDIDKLGKAGKKLTKSKTPSETPNKIPSESGKFDSIEEVNIPKKEIVVAIPEQTKGESVPKTRPLQTPKKYFPTPKNNNKFLIIFFGTLIAMILIVGIICFTVTFQKKDFNPSITNNVDIPENPININNEFPENRTTIVNIDLDGDLAKEIADLVIEKLNQTNSS